MHDKAQADDTVTDTEARLTRTKQPIEATAVPGAMLTMKTAASVCGLSTATLYRLASSDPKFPRLIKLGQRCTRIKASELAAWVAAQ